MPYIGGERSYLNRLIEGVCLDVPYWSGRPGVLNYVLTRILLAFIGPAPTYTDFNAAIGALECAKLELYRRMVAPYEDRKCAENGDVYPEMT